MYVSVLAVHTEPATWNVISISSCVDIQYRSHTVFHEFGLLQRRLHLLEQRQARNIQGRAVTCQVAHARHMIQVVGERDAVTCGDLLDFVLIVAVERSPVNNAVDGLGGTPIESNIMPGMADNKLPSFICAWKRDDKGAELQVGAWSVDMGFEEAGWRFIDLLMMLSALQTCQANPLTFSLYSSALIPCIPRFFPVLGSRTCAIVLMMPVS